MYKILGKNKIKVNIIYPVLDFWHSLREIFCSRGQKITIGNSQNHNNLYLCILCLEHIIPGYFYINV